MLKTIIFPNDTGADIAAGNDIDLPSGAAYIDEIVSAQLMRTRAGLAIADHGAADIVASVDDHPQAEVATALADHGAADIVASVDDHEQVEVVDALADHTLDTQQALDGAVTNALGHDATPELETAAAANVEIAGAISDHAAGVNPVSHSETAVDVGHAAGADAVSHSETAVDVDHTVAGSDNVVVTTATKVDGNTIELDEDFEEGDLLLVSYVQLGSRLLTAQLRGIPLNRIGRGLISPSN